MSTTTLDTRLKTARTNFYNSISAFLGGDEVRETFGVATISIKNIFPIISAFQVCHVPSLIFANKYAKEEEMKALAEKLGETLFDVDHELSMGFLTRYTEAKESYELIEQCEILMQDICLQVLGQQGSVLSPGLATSGMQFLYTNWGITADYFDDDEVLKDCLESINNLQKRPNLKN